MSKKGIFLVSLILINLSGCIDREPLPYQLPKNAALSNYQILSLFFIEQLNEAPIKQIPAWNDSILKLTGISSIHITAKGMKNPEDISESIYFRFNKSGIISGFEHIKLDVSKDPLTTMEFDQNKGKIVSYFGENVDQKLKMEQFDQGVRFIRMRSPEFQDTFTVIGTLERPLIILEKSANHLSRINVILQENEPVKKMEALISKLQIDPKDLFLAEKNVTYVDEHYRPLRTYLVGEEYVQTSLVAEWNYESHKKLTSYNRFVNSSPIKQYEFQYSEDKLLRSFTYNRINYFVDYH
jgi:hypothetical protein